MTINMPKSETDDSCSDCGRGQCWGGSVCSEIKKDLLSDISYEKTEEI